MKKILFVITQSEFGGAQRFLDTLVSHLSKDKYQILIATGSDGDGKFLSHLHKHGFAIHKFAHLVRKPNPYHDVLAVFELRRLIKKLQPNTLFLLSSKAGVIGSLTARFTNYHLPITINSSFNKWETENGKWKMRPRVVYRIGGWTFNDPWPAWKKRFWIMLEKWTAKYKDIIIVNNQHDFDQAKSLHIKPRQSLELIHNGLDISEINFLSRDEARKKLLAITNYQLPITDFWIGTIANFYPTKGLEFLIEAVHNLQITNYQLLPKFVIIGDGELRSKLELLITNYHLQDVVILLGRIDDARRYLKAFDIFVLPSVKEGFPWAILEAMGAGLPVIATRVGAVPEVIEDGQNGLLVELRNPTQIADKIEQLLSNDALRLRLGTQAIQTVSQNFSLANMLKEIEKLLQIKLS